MMATEKIPNKLIDEKSPYLLQHAYNPVNWYGWHEEAFKKAVEEDKPIFLSIGYSTCHWCHVMEQESFEDEEVANLMNSYFVAIKVDREERPDIDSVYMTVCQGLAGQGGWPLTIIMTPDKKPFFAGTYFPKHARYRRPGLLEILNKIGLKWQYNKEDFIKSSEEILGALQSSFSYANEEEVLSKSVVVHAARIFESTYDHQYGGFGDAPKFPSPHNLMFLMRYYYFTKEEPVLKMVEHTLDSMYKGGIFDHIGFGFSRYSTDKRWLVPHFEKMLYDNALLTITYLEAYQITKKPLYKEVAKKTIAYVLRELTDETGGFYSAQDADSEGEEGKFYVFNPLEILQLMGEEDGNDFNTYFDITHEGNFEGKSIPNLIHNKQYEEANGHIEELREKIFAYRQGRMALHKDDKILTSWNALMIVALAKAYKILQEPLYLEYAKKCLSFIFNTLKDETGRLLARYRDGHAAYLAYLEDYAFMVWALTELYEATFDSAYLKEALQLNEEMIRLFWDEEQGGFFLYGKDAETLIARPKELYDGAMPSGNSVAAYNLIKLARLTGESRLEELAHRQLKVFAKSVKAYPIQYSFYLLALLFEVYPSKELVAIFEEEKDKDRLKEFLSLHFMPELVTLIKDQQIEEIIAYIKDYAPVNKEATYYLCENKVCKAPFHNLNSML